MDAHNSWVKAKAIHLMPRNLQQALALFSRATIAHCLQSLGSHLENRFEARGGSLCHVLPTAPLGAADVPAQWSEVWHVIGHATRHRGKPSFRPVKGVTNFFIDYSDPHFTSGAVRAGAVRRSV
jgi:hypothetical protein